MADLYDRIYNENPDNETPQLNTHGLTSSLILYSVGEFTSNQVKNFWNMDAAAIIDWDALVANIDGTTGTANKLVFLHRLEAAGIATEVGAITTKAAFKSAAGI